MSYPIQRNATLKFEVLIDDVRDEHDANVLSTMIAKSIYALILPVKQYHLMVRTLVPEITVIDYSKQTHGEVVS